MSTLTSAIADADGDSTLREARLRVGIGLDELAARTATDLLDPLPRIDAEWLAKVENGTLGRPLTYREWQTIGRSLLPPRPDWWEEGYEHDVRFAWSGHQDPARHEYERRRYRARVRTVAEECDRPYRAVPDPLHELSVICELLNAYQVAFVVIGSAAAIGHGAAVETQDIDLVPAMTQRNVERLCDALNVLRPRWWWPTDPNGRKIDGGRLEPRHFRNDVDVLALITRLGPINVMPQPRGFEDGYEALRVTMVRRVVRDVVIPLAALEDIIHSKRLLDRPKDRGQLPALYRRLSELRANGDA
ncbi:MAG: hypothetical protein ACR2MA_04675 [Egibacteraceae bacterium]